MWSVFVRTVFRLNLVKCDCLVIFNLMCSRKSRGGVYEGYPNHVESLKRVVFKETVESRRWRSETRNLNSGSKQ